MNNQFDFRYPTEEDIEDMAVEYGKWEVEHDKI